MSFEGSGIYLDLIYKKQLKRSEEANSKLVMIKFNDSKIVELSKNSLSGNQMWRSKQLAHGKYNLQLWNKNLDQVITGTNSYFGFQAFIVLNDPSTKRIPNFIWWISLWFVLVSTIIIGGIYKSIKFWSHRRWAESGEKNGPRRWHIINSRTIKSNLAGLSPVRTTKFEMITPFSLPSPDSDSLSSFTQPKHIKQIELPKRLFFLPLFGHKIFLI
ncbi:expressed protein [Phakopsora pachyrhizi]|uniref:Expressed protein n=1 Tax=Phakopsora pachyrhizi TaxID=170000 RepID=A0AAV0B5R2_PHAPC|nr:expressed protein [Phakopsora pachyrhizi]